MRKLKLFKILFLFLFASLANAEVYIPIQGKHLWSLGFDVFEMYAEPRGDFKQLFRSSKVGSTIYLADRFNNPFGFEFGYSWTDRKPKGYQAVPGSTLFNTTATTTSNYNGHIRLKDTYLDIQAHLPMTKHAEAKFSIGVGFVRQGIDFINVPKNPSDPLQAVLFNIEGRTAITWRFGIGAQSLVWDRVGLRCILMYQTMTNIQVRGVPNGVSQKILDNSIALNFGIYWTLTGLREPYPPP